MVKFLKTLGLLAFVFVGIAAFAVLFYGLLKVWMIGMVCGWEELCL